MYDGKTYRTQYKGLRYANIGPGQWRYVDATDPKNKFLTGDTYPSRESLLMDIGRYARDYNPEAAKTEDEPLVARVTLAGDCGRYRRTGEIRIDLRWPEDSETIRNLPQRDAAAIEHVLSCTLPNKTYRRLARIMHLQVEGA